jgi:ABC-type sugar transport system ATPase subunit
VFVAHRLRTIFDSDQILVLKDGHVVETGSHRELLDLDGVYAELWNGKHNPIDDFQTFTDYRVAQETSLDGEPQNEA